MLTTLTIEVQQNHVAVTASWTTALADDGIGIQQVGERRLGRFNYTDTEQVLPHGDAHSTEEAIVALKRRFESIVENLESLKVGSRTLLALPPRPTRLALPAIGESSASRRDPW
jgi:hypothetical protein